jgi:Ca2+-binding RTX toxin-like protein
VSISGVKVVGGTEAVSVFGPNGNTRVDSLTVTNSEFVGQSNGSVIVDLQSGTSDLSSLTITNVKISQDNTVANENAKHQGIVAWGFDGNATITNVTIEGEVGVSSATASAPYYGILLQGSTKAYTAPMAAGNVTLTDVTVNGAFAKSAVGVYNYTNIDNVTGTNVDVSGSLNGPAPWGQAVTISGVDGSYDASRLGLVLGSNYTQLGVDTTPESNNTLTGTAGADVLYDAMGGNDTLIGGAGNDTLSGGAGNDTAVVNGTTASDALFGRQSGTNALTVSTSLTGTDVLSGVEFVALQSANQALLKTFVMVDEFANNAAAIAAAPSGAVLVKAGPLNVSLVDAASALAKALSYYGPDAVTINASAADLLAAGPSLGQMRASGVDTFTTTDVISKAEYDILVTNTGAAGSIVLPSVTITDDEANVANIAGGAVVYTFTFATPVTNFTASDVTVTNGTVGALVASTVPAEVGRVFTMAVTPTPGFDGNMSLTVANAASGNQAVDTLISTAVALDLTSDTGANTADDLTKTPLSTFEVTFNAARAEAGDTIEVIKGGVVLGTATLNGTTAAAGKVSVMLTTALTEGNTNSLTAKHSDAAGNAISSSALAVTLDTVAPDAPIAKLSASSDTGVASDNRSNQTSVTLDVASLEAGRVATYSLNSGAAQTYSGSSFNLTGLSANTTHTVVVNQTDMAGNLSASSSYTFTVDTLAPSLLSSAGLNTTQLQTFWNAQLQSDGVTVKLLFSEAMDPSHMAGVIGNLKVQAAGYTVDVTNAVMDSINPNMVILTLEKAITTGVTAKVSYTDPAGETVSAVLQDIAGNDLASGLWTAKSLSAVNAATVSADVRVFDGGLFGGTGNNTLTYKGQGTEFLSGGAGDDTIKVSATGNAASWLIASYAMDTSTDTSNLGIQANVGTGQNVYNFTQIGQYANSVFAQGESIDVGTSKFKVNGAVLQIASAANETLYIDTDVIGANSSIQIGSGKGSETIIDETDSTLRSDTVLYKLAASNSDQGVNADALLASRSALLAAIESVMTPTVDNTMSVKIGGKTDTLQGMERVQFLTGDGSTVNVAMVGNAVGNNGYHSLAAMTADVAVGGNNVQAVIVSKDNFKGQDHSSVLSQIDGMFSTTVNNRLALNLNPGSDSPTELIGTSKVIFETKDSSNPVTVLIVGADGYASIDAAMNDAQPGDVIYITDNALTGATNYTVFKEGMIFMANSSSANNQLTLELGYLEIPATAENPNPVQSNVIQSLFLMGNANINVNGNQMDNVIVGNRGNNLILGNDGNDKITTGGGADMVYGGIGNDTLVAQSGSASGSTLLNGGAGNDLLIVATTDNARVVMTGGVGEDTFKVGSLASDNGNLALNAVITDLSARNGDHLDFSQLLNSSGAAVSKAEAFQADTYSGGNLVFNFTNALNFKSTSTDVNAVGELIDTIVNVRGSVTVNMTTVSNVENALEVKDSVPGKVHKTIAQDVYGTDSSLSAEIQKLVPLFERNPID